MPIISIRPPTLYGRGVTGPFAALMKAAQLGVPLPLGAVHNKRSMAFVDNLADAVIAAATSSIAGTFIVTDHLPLSTADLYRKLLAAYGHGDRVWRWPAGLVKAVTAPIGARADSIIGDAACDGGRFATAVGWQPAVAMDEAILRTAGARC
jgi:UDP-glucose 4-epimerase